MTGSVDLRNGVAKVIRNLDLFVGRCLTVRCVVKIDGMVGFEGFRSTLLCQ